MKVEITSAANLEQVLTDSIPFVSNECADPFQTVTPCWHEKSFVQFNIRYFGGAL